MSEVDTVRPVIPFAIAIGAVLVGCSSRPAQTEEPTPPSSAAVGASATALPTAPSPRVFADLGPPRLVPQLRLEGVAVERSADGALVIVGLGEADTTLQVWDADRKLVVAELTAPFPMYDATVRFTPDGRFVVATGGQWAAAWRAETGRLAGAFTYDAEGGRSAVMPGDPGALPAGEPLQWTVGLPSTGAGGAAGAFGDERHRPHFELAGDGGITMSCAPDRSVAYGFPPDSRSLEEARATIAAEHAARAAAEGARILRTEGKVLAIGDGFVDVWMVGNASKLRRIEFEGVSNEASVAPSPDGKLLAVVASFGTIVVVFDLESGTQLAKLDHGHSIWQIQWNPVGSVIVTTARMPVGGVYLPDENASIKLWSPRTGRLMHKFAHHYNVAYSENNHLLATWSYHELDIYDAKTLDRIFRGGGAYTYGVLSPDGRYVAMPLVDTSGAHPGMFDAVGLEVKGIANSTLVRTFPFKTDFAQFSSDGALIVLSRAEPWSHDAQSRSFDVGVYDVTTGTGLQGIAGPGAITLSELDPTNARLYASVRGMVRGIRLKDGAGVWLQPVVHRDGCGVIAFDDQGRFDAEEALLPSIKLRLGDDLRHSAIVSADVGSPLRKPGLYRDFVEGR